MLIQDVALGKVTSVCCGIRSLKSKNSVKFGCLIYWRILGQVRTAATSAMHTTRRPDSQYQHMEVDANVFRVI